MMKHDYDKEDIVFYLEKRIEQLEKELTICKNTTFLFEFLDENKIKDKLKYLQEKYTDLDQCLQDSNMSSLLKKDICEQMNKLEKQISFLVQLLKNKK